MQTVVLGGIAWYCVGVLCCLLCLKASSIAQRTLFKQYIEELKNYSTEAELELSGDETAIESISQMLDVVKLAASRENAIADYSRDLICSFDSNFAVAAINSACERILGYSSIELLGKSLSSIIVEADNTRLQKLLEETRGTRRAVSFELRLLTRHGKVVDTAWQAEWSETEKMFFAIARDISEQKAEERQRREIIAMISHDVRSPLSSTLLGVSALTRGIYGDISTQARQTLGRMEKSITRIIDLLTELLDLEKSMDGELKLDKRDFSIRNLVADAVEQLTDLCLKLNVRVENSADEALVFADRDRIMRVVVNLLSNAVKHSPPDSVVSIATVIKAREVEITVQDHGPGIPEHLQRAIFERFVQLETPGRAEVPSTGLGLTICKSFIEAHKGLIGVRSEPGKGSTFWFVLPRSEHVS